MVGAAAEEEAVAVVEGAVAAVMLGESAGEFGEVEVMVGGRTIYV